MSGLTTVMASSLIGKGVPIGAFAARIEALPMFVLACPAEVSTAPPMASGTADTARTVWPEAAMAWAALALAWALACPELPTGPREKSPSAQLVAQAKAPQSTSIWRIDWLLTAMTPLQGWCIASLLKKLLAE